MAGKKRTTVAPPRPFGLPARRKFVAVEYPDGALSESLMKAEALTLVLQHYVTSNRADEAPLREHWLHWYLEALRDHIIVAQKESESLESLSPTQGAANG